jgi:lipoyl synthase
MARLPILEDSTDAAPLTHLAPPPWLRVKAPSGDRYKNLQRMLRHQRLHTVCHSAACPNMGECWSAGTATFMILGNHCTRACRFCDVLTSAKPPPVDLEEPHRLADAVEEMGLKHVVITSVARDDLSDGGARQFVRCIEAVRTRRPDATIEILVPDFKGSLTSLQMITEANPDIFNHNLETVRRCTPKVRSGAEYDRSLEVLAAVKRLSPSLRTKSGFMLGLGETDQEIHDALVDVRRARVDIISLGQYLRPSPKHLPVQRYVTPERFDQFASFGRELGFQHVESGPLVRSSYHAERALP